ncbi:unnamed protein product [Closterium sp. NIES-64]|nr:unnamed protein product [Closterium sp. NIES-64]
MSVRCLVLTAMLSLGQPPGSAMGAVGTRLMAAFDGPRWGGDACGPQCYECPLLVPDCHAVAGHCGRWGSHLAPTLPSDCIVTTGRHH